MSETLSKLDDLEVKIKARLDKYDELLKFSRGASSKAAELEVELKRKNDKISQLEEELKVLKTVGAIQKNGTDVAEAKGRISVMVREIDKCIALLNS